jgi:hypothetical protein
MLDNKPANGGLLDLHQNLRCTIFHDTANECINVPRISSYVRLVIQTEKTATTSAEKGHEIEG